MNKPGTHPEAKPYEKKESDTRVDVSTADDVNVDDENAVGSPKNGLSAEESGPPESVAAEGMMTSIGKNPGDEVAPGTEQTGRLPCERCGGTGQLESQACPDCGGSGEVVVNVGDA